MASIDKTKMADMQICEVRATLALLYDIEIIIYSMRPHNHYT
jgi:hypothetical protein